MSRRRHAFTLIEMLVVIGIIGLLMSILLPTLNRAREQAKSVTCASNERQLYMAFMTYANENRGRVPIPSSTGDTNPTLSVCFVMKSLGVCDYVNGTWWPYIARTGEARFGVMNCPTDLDSVRVMRKGAMSLVPRNFSYSLNSDLRALPKSPDGTGIKFNAIVHPGEKIVIVEELWPNDGKAVINSEPPDLDDLPATRHTGRGNFCFGDGHVLSLLPMEIGYSNNHPDTDPNFHVVNSPLHLSMTELFK
ncbi:MAG TPA: type II secretion system protein [Tepidisphaeraceae bacterium]|jgi:prepilin-type N-terminal cleavage/methylation domain-containing protein/prepilin-type processing-associated H-X9-DG protein